MNTMLGKLISLFDKVNLKSGGKLINLELCITNSFFEVHIILFTAKIFIL